MPAGQPVILADTVGFIRHLPHDLVAAFRSTLTETRDADLLLHVVDASSNERDANIHQVNEVLKEIEAEDRPQLMVYNKIDLMEQVEPHIERDELDIPIRVWVSALNGQGLDLLMQAVEERVNADVVEQYLVLPPKAGRLRAKIFQYGKILHEDHSPDGEWLLSVQMPRSDWNMLCHRESIHEYAAKEPQTRLAVASEAP